MSFAPGVTDIWKKKKRKNRAGWTSVSHLPVHLSTKLGEAEALFIAGDDKNAIEILSAISKEAPRLPEPYKIMALIYEENNDLSKALQSYALAATFSPRSLDLVQKVRSLAATIGDYKQALVAAHRCVSLSPTALAHLERINLSTKLPNSYEQIKPFIKKFLSLFPRDFKSILLIGEKLILLDHIELALNCFLRVIFEIMGMEGIDLSMNLIFPFTVDPLMIDILDVEDLLPVLFFAIGAAVNILLDMEKETFLIIKIFDKCLAILQELQFLQGPDSPVHFQLPFELAFLYGNALLSVEKEEFVDLGLSIINPLLRSLEEHDFHLFVWVYSVFNDDAVDSMKALDLCYDDVLEGAFNDVGNQDMTSDDIDENENFNDMITMNDINELQNNVKGYNEKGLIYTNVRKLEEYRRNDIFLLTQSLRLIHNFMTNGVKTRAEKLITVISTHLEKLTSSITTIIDNFNASTESNRPNQENKSIVESFEILSKHLRLSLSRLWNLLGNESQSMDNHESENLMKVTEYYEKAYKYNPTDSRILLSLCSLTQEKFPEKIPDVINIVENHFCDVLNLFNLVYEQTLEQEEGETKEDLEEDINNDNMKIVEENENDFAGLDLLPPITDPETNVDDWMDNAATIMEKSINEKPREKTKKLIYNPRKLAHDPNAVHKTQINTYLRLIVEWALLLYKIKDYTKFSALVLPMIESWINFGTEKTPPQNLKVHYRNRQNFIHMHMISKGFSGEMMRSQQKLVDPVKEITIVTVGAQEVRSFSIEGISGKGQEYWWLNEDEKILSTFVAAFTDFVVIQELITTPVLVDLVIKVEGCLKSFERFMGSNKEKVETGEEFGRYLIEQSNIASLRRNSKKSKITASMRKIPHEYFYHLQQRELENKNEDDGDDDDNNELDYEDDSESENQNVSGIRKKGFGSDSIRAFGKKAQLESGGIILNDFRNFMALKQDDPMLDAAKFISSEAVFAVEKLLKYPGDINAANSLFRALIKNQKRFTETGISPIFENKLPISTFFDAAEEKNDKLIASLLLGFDHAMFNRHGEVLESFLDSFRVDPGQPLVALCLGTYLIMLSSNSALNNRFDAQAKGLAFMNLYCNLRLILVKKKLDEEGDNENRHTLSYAGARQETLYNLGRCFQELHMLHIAVHYYQLALNLVEQYPVLRNIDTSLQLTRETAHNLVIIYRYSGAKELAFDIMSRFLVI